MGNDLRMPAAFKALQRSRPPEDPEQLISNSIATIALNGGTEYSDHPITIPQKYSKLDKQADFDFMIPSSSDASRVSDANTQAGSACASSGNASNFCSSVEDINANLGPRFDLKKQYKHVDKDKQLLLQQESCNDVNNSHQNNTYSSVAQGRAAEQRSLIRPTFATQTPRMSRNNSITLSTQNPTLTSFASTASFSSSIDQYGFKKPLNSVREVEYNEWAENYTKYMAHREEKWRALLKAHGLDSESQRGVPVKFPPESQRLRRYVRKGIPPKWRGNAWFWFARGHEKLNARPGLYKEYVEASTGLKNSDTEHIERDLHRTFPDNIYFRNDPVTNEESAHLKALRRVLQAFSLYQPKIGYCQSLNFIAGNLLLFMDEERTFWMLVIITQNYLAGLHEVNLEQVNISQGILMISVRDRLPKIWNALNLEQSFEDNFISNLPPISLCTAPWFMSIMVNIMPTESMLRVWDCFFLEGPKTLYRIALTIFKLIEPQMTRATDEIELFQIIQSAPPRLYDPEVLMKACFKRANGFGHISNEDIALLRSFVQSRRQQAGDGVKITTSDRHAYAKLHRGRRVRAKLSLYR